MVDGPERALQPIDAIAVSGALDDYWPLHAARVELLRRLNRLPEAWEVYSNALVLMRLPAERALLQRQTAIRETLQQ